MGINNQFAIFQQLLTEEAWAMDQFPLPPISIALYHWTDSIKFLSD